MSALLWRVKVDSYRELLNTCRCVDTAEKDWRFFDNWDRRFDKLPVISTKLSLRVMGADVSGKDWRLFGIWDRRFDKSPVISAKLSLRVMGADASGKARCLSDF
ncbi:hypothetical protein TB2_039951 [Malus domestica]